MKAKAIKGFPVVSLEDGSLLGKVQELLVDPLEKKVEALLIGEKGFLKGRTQFIFYDRVKNIGRDVITAEADKQPTTQEDHTRLENLKKGSFLGNSIISQDGNYLARVQDYTFNTQTGSIEYLHLFDCRKEFDIDEGTSLDMEGVLNLGRDYVIAQVNYEEYLVKPEMEEKSHREDAGISREAGKTDSRTEGEKEEFREESYESSQGNVRGQATQEEGHTNAIFDKLKDLWSNLEWEISREGKHLAKETREKMKRYTLGKKASYTVRDIQGYPLVTAGETIDENTINKAEAQERMGMLFLSAISHEVEDGVGVIGDKISSFFRA
ncbi:MAG TPA: hypothetical protein GXZ24_03545 [Firmicutes bacterium]|nr:hypothetical protein [Bacillota bacterium]